MFNAFHPKIVNVSYNKFDSKPIPLSIKRNKLLGLEISEIVQLNSSSRAKFSCFHSNDDKEHPWIAVAFHSGEIKVFDYDGNIVFTIGDADPHIPKRCVKFIERLNCLIFGSDSFSIWIYNYVANTLEKVTEGHLDYIRCLCVHPRLPYLISCADDQTIRLWNWENNWKLEEVFTGHEHYIMYICMHPDNPNIIASGSLDSTVRVWNFNMDAKYEAFSNNRHQREYPYYQQKTRVLSPPKTNPLLTTLKGFQAGVDCVDFYKGSDPEKRNWLVASADDKTVRIFDWKRSQCVTVIPALHGNNVLSCLFEKDILFTGGEDHVVNALNAHSLALISAVKMHNYKRIWHMEIDKCTLQKDEETFKLAISFDRGLVLFSVHKRMSETNKVQPLDKLLEQLADVTIMTLY